jgi:ubiquinone/menaquinone biosynthesis C-methylase UbiE
LSFIPDDFDGILLDVPVGTGVLTFEKYMRLKRARIIAIDYSFGMLLKAKQRFAGTDIKNITLIRADVGNLPIEDAGVDLCLSMNGFHAFPEKDCALKEIHRTLRDKGKFAGCFYIKGKRWFTDFLVGIALSKSGTFTPPFHDEAETLALLGKCFDVCSTGNMRSIFYFYMNKK